MVTGYGAYKIFFTIIKGGITQKLQCKKGGTTILLHDTSS